LADVKSKDWVIRSLNNKIDHGAAVEYKNYDIYWLEDSFAETPNRKSGLEIAPSSLFSQRLPQNLLPLEGIDVNADRYRHQR
jgi:hypothetical protein